MGCWSTRGADTAGVTEVESADKLGVMLLLFMGTLEGDEVAMVLAVAVALAVVPIPLVVPLMP